MPDDDYVYDEVSGEWIPASQLTSQHKNDDDQVVVKDSLGNILSEGDSVTTIKDLDVKGANVTLKRGTIMKNIRLTNNPEEIEGNVDKVRGLVLKTCFVKKN
jgi:protein PhnA